MLHKVNDWTVAAVVVKYTAGSQEEIQRLIDGGTPDVYMSEHGVEEVTIRQTRTVRLISDRKLDAMTKRRERAWELAKA